MKCERCGTEHEGSFGTGRFCSRACANSRQWNEEDKRKKSESAKKSEKVLAENRSRSRIRRKELLLLDNIERNKRGKILIPRICPVCKDKFKSTKHKQTYCSKKCWLDDKEQKYCKPRGSGGARPGAGHSKQGYYKGFQCDSTYELAYVIWCNEKGISIERNKEYWEYFDPNRNGTFKFYPDFLVNGKLVEIKGYHTPVVDLKINAVKNSGRGIEILYKNDLKNAFDVAVKLTGFPKDRLFKAYDDHKPIYDHMCACGTEFSNNKKNSVFCSLRCCGIYGGRKKKS